MFVYGGGGEMQVEKVGDRSHLIWYCSTELYDWGRRKQHDAWKKSDLR